MEGPMIFEALTGWEMHGRPGTMQQKRERRVLQRLLHCGSAYAAIQAQSGTPTAKQLYVFLGHKYDLDVVDLYLCQEQWKRYMAALQREPSIFRLGLEYLDSTEPAPRVEIVDVAPESEDLARVYRGDPRGRGGQ